MPDGPTLQDKSEHRLVLVTGPSGAGRSTAVKVLEDLGFEAIDNLPLSLLPRLLDGPPLERSLALGLDVRNRDFSVNALLDLTRKLSEDPRVQADMLYLDASADALLRRYSETRRRHPMAPEEAPELGIEREFDLLEPLRSQASILIDTTDLTPHDLRADLQRWFDVSPSTGLAVSVQSFSYKRGVPRGVDTVFDCRFLRNPHWEPDLRSLDGRDERVQEFVEQDPLCQRFFEGIVEMAELLLPAYRDEGKSHLTIGFGCTGGQHRSVALTEKLANTLAKAGWQVSKRHRELERHARSAPLAIVGN